MKKQSIREQGAPINLRAVINDRLEVNFHSAVYRSTALAAGERSVRVRLINNDLSRLLSADMNCIIEFLDRDARSAVIRGITGENGWLLLECEFLTGAPGGAWVLKNKGGLS